MTSSNYHIAQVNIARMLAPLDDPIMAEFVALLAQINALADNSPGFVWRLQTEHGNATYLRPYDDDRILFNLSVWESVWPDSGVRKDGGRVSADGSTLAHIEYPQEP